MQNDTAAMGPVFDRKSPKEYPKEVPMMMLGGSPHMVADPPRFAQKISANIKGTGSNLRADDNSIVTAARKRITVMLSMNIAKTAESIMEVKNTGTILKFTILAIDTHSHLKKPVRAINSTISIIPAIKIIVAQCIPAVFSVEAASE